MLKTDIGGFQKEIQPVKVLIHKVLGQFLFKNTILHFNPYPAGTKSDKILPPV